MRLMPALLLSTALTASPALAADITYDGAKQLEDQLNGYLPADLAKAGVIKVRPGTGDYEVNFDAAPILKKFDPTTITISGLKPFLSLVRPLDDGTWNVSQKDNLDIKGTFTANAQKTDFTYRIGDFRMDGIYDPDLLYFRSADMAATDIHTAWQSAQQNVDATFTDMKSVLQSTKAGPQTIDLQSKTTMGAFIEKIVDAGQPPVEIKAEAIDANVTMNGLAYKPVQDAVFFLLDKKDQKTLDDAEQARLKDIGRANLPLFDSLLESIDVKNPQVVTPQGTFAAETLNYTISSNGLRDGAKLAFGVSIEKPAAPPNVIPAAFMPALPETITTQVSLENINITSGIKYFLDNADFNSAKTLSDAQSAEAAKIFLPGGALTIRYDDVSARSSVYDISMTGTTTVYPADPQRQNTDITLYARDFDKTVNYLQQNAQAVPQFGQAAFVLLMVKGFAKTAPDGRQMWNLVIDENKRLTINGQAFPMGR